MINPTIAKDVILAGVWATARFLPFWIYYQAIIHIREDKFVVGLILSTILFGAVYGVILWLTNSWPALLWRYNAKLETRIIRANDDNLHQIKLFGNWYFMQVSDNEVALSIRTWASPQRFYEMYNFESEFTNFINEHREDQNPNVRETTTFVRGEKAK